MNKRMTKIWGIVLVVTLLVSLFAALPASAGTLSWSSETLPSATNVVLVPTAGMDINDLAISADGTTIYAAMGTGGGVASQKLYKSLDAGVSWTVVTTPNNAAGDAVNKVAIAPDDANTLVIIGTDAGTQKAWVSTNGGSNFYDLSITAANTYYDLDISVSSSGVRNIGVVGTAAANTPLLLYFNLGAAAPVWTNALTSTGWTAPAAMATVDSFRAIKWSPQYASDKIATVVSEELAAAGGARFHMVSFATKKWDGDAGFTSYPVSLITATVNTVDYASIALAPDYLGADEASRLAYVGSSLNAATTEAGGIFRLSDVTVKSLKTTDIYSIAYDGSKLLAGAVSSNIVYRSADPTATSPTVSAATLYKRPGVDAAATNEKTLVGWAGTTAVAGTSGKSSAFAVSADSGASFKDISLIDTALTTLEDVWVTSDAAKRYLLTDDGDVTSLFRYDGAWARVFAIDDTPNGYIVRGAASDGNVVYIADTAATTMYYTADAGATKWSLRAASNNIIDLAVESKDVAYIAVNAAKTVSKTTNAGFTWATAKDTTVSAGNLATIVSLGTDKLIVGSDAGYVAYSTDGNSSWTKIDKITETGSTTVQVTASGLATNDYIYATSIEADTHVSRWQIGVSSSWTDLTAPTDTSVAPDPIAITNPKAYGIALSSGALYVLVSNGTDSEVWRTLSPTSANPTSGMWALLTTTGNLFDSAPSALRVSGTVKLWAIKTNTDALYSYSDTLATASLSLVSPAVGFTNPVNPVTGRSVDIPFSWTKPSDKVTDYTVKIYTDAAATAQVKSVDVTSSDTTPVVLIGPFNNALEYSPGTTYYWRVRVKTPILSPYSEIRSFTIQPGTALSVKTLAPDNGATGVRSTPAFSWEPVAGTTKYRFLLATSPDLTSPLVDTTTTSTAYAVTTPLAAGKTYYWSVQALEPVQGERSAVANFTIAVPVPTVAPTTAPPPVIVTQVPAPTIILPTPQPAPTIILPTPVPPPAPTAPGYIWAVIIIGAILVIAVIVLIVRTRRTV